MDLGPIDYASTTPPQGYRCTACGGHGCKLWRDCLPTFTRYLLCCDCAGAWANKDTGRIDAAGRQPLRTPRQRRRLARFGRRGRRGARPVPAGSTDTIGFCVPAIPTTEEGGVYWGYSALHAEPSPPPEGVAWWVRLPTRPLRAANGGASA